MTATPEPTDADRAYAARLQRLADARWKRVLDVQRPYRRNLRRLATAPTLDIGCGIGRNLEHLGAGAVGVDPNAAAVAVARSRGSIAFTPDEFARSAYAEPGRFNTLLFSHVLEHLPRADATELVRRYLPALCPGGTVILITPQERGYRSDPTHVTYLDLDALAELAADAGLTPTRRASFPFPRAAGRLFPYNEFVLVATRP